jgi:phosphoribosylamine--glycine ligase
MNVLIIGNGGREAALAWKIAQSNVVESVLISPLHPAATTLHAKIKTSETIPDKKFDLAVIGPEIPLGEGLADQLRVRGIPTVGPSQKAAQLEISKAFAKEAMLAAEIPTARSATFTTSAEARAFVDLCDWEGIVVKADGPAAGKGVVVAQDKKEALRAISGFFDGSWLGMKVNCLVLEEKLVGPEISVFALCAGEKFVWLDSARDHKRLKENDLGPNTGGMGTVSPVLDFNEKEKTFVKDHVFAPLLKLMVQRGTPFQGFLFAGLMRTKAGLKVLEFNVRMGDPETQVVLPRMTDDLVPWLIGCATNNFPKGSPVFSPEVCVHVVLAAPGYPGTEGEKVRLGDEVYWSPSVAKKYLSFPAGLTLKDDKWVTRGGRILGVTGIGMDLKEARTHALTKIEKFAFEGSQWRRDIGGSL